MDSGSIRTSVGDVLKFKHLVGLSRLGLDDEYSDAAWIVFQTRELMRQL